MIQIQNTDVEDYSSLVFIKDVAKLVGIGKQKSKPGNQFNQQANPTRAQAVLQNTVRSPDIRNQGNMGKDKEHEKGQEQRKEQI